MNIEVRQAEYPSVEALRELYRAEAQCQIICDGDLPRGLADPFLVLLDGRVAGYGAVRNRIDQGRLTEFYSLPYARAEAPAMFCELLRASGTKEIAAQTNMPSLLMLLYDYATDITTEKILFEDTLISNLTCPDGLVRLALDGENSPDPGSPWVVDVEGALVAAGGFLCHYNPPYADIYMTVAEDARRRGYGSYLVQELKKICYEAGKKPGARCDPRNTASRKSLEKAGFLACGRLLVGQVVSNNG